MGDLGLEFEPVRRIWREAGWPGVTDGLSWGTPGLTVGKKMLVRIREPDVLVIGCDLDEKEALMMLAPEIYFETPHYRGYPAVLVRLSAIEPEVLRDHLEKSWRKIAPKKLVKEFDASR